jgi:hypothetical protein
MPRASRKIWKDDTSDPFRLSRSSGVTSPALWRLASGGEDGQIKLWLVDEQKLIAALCLRAGRNLTKDEWDRYIGSDTPWQLSYRDLRSREGILALGGSLPHHALGCNSVLWSIRCDDQASGEAIPTCAGSSIAMLVAAQSRNRCGLIACPNPSRVRATMRS